MGTTLCGAPVKTGDGQAVDLSHENVTCTLCLMRAMATLSNSMGAIHARLDVVLGHPQRGAVVETHSDAQRRVDGQLPQPKVTRGARR